MFAVSLNMLEDLYAMSHRIVWVNQKRGCKKVVQHKEQVCL